ncbi:MAG: hypothetical protein WBC91_13365, partial [Phototrophicaceae bacterium]
MDTQFISILRTEMEKYTGEGLNGASYLTENMNQTVFTSTTIYTKGEIPQPFVDLFVRIIADKIVIEEDRNDKPLVDALVQAGIPR